MNTARLSNALAKNTKEKVQPTTTDAKQAVNKEILDEESLNEWSRLRHIQTGYTRPHIIQKNSSTAPTDTPQDPKKKLA